ncbi:phosphatidate cytidylyltransferase [Caldovatus aquaticus]|uniref:Phosphatidate cytidylyltransferase n=1 Tax=Caldovatus aquaticus TaxID=2865671 RepID=A0ABS7F3B3_9PROT|nr:phosphatidate cytidylyltransferase [Caldovatus aquaticus]MBW8269316.1 phosphatidate cytidylyltransferase [Caldovatus aquaticus]
MSTTAFGGDEGSPSRAASPGTAPPRRWTDLRKRVLSALVLGPAALACIWFGAALWTVLVAAAAAVLAWEWVHLCGLSTRAAPGIAVPAAVLAAGALAVAGWPLAGLALLVAGFGLTWIGAARLGAAGRLPARDGVAVPAGALAAGVLYIGLAGLALITLRDDNDAGRANVLFLFLVVWASDIGAYVTGRALGGPKLAPAVSPNKTWSGAAGGLAAAVLVGTAAAAVLAPGGEAWRSMAVAAFLGVMAQAGDLLESWIKRRFRVKDASRLIPGHGGLLDRLDGVLAAAPAAALLAWILGAGTPLWQ